MAAYFLAGGPWAVVGAVAGAVTGSFAPSVYDRVHERELAQQSWRGTAEQAPPQGWARLLDPRREVVSFAGREDELATLVAWCEDDRAPRLRLVTGPGGVGKTRLAVELAARMTVAAWRCERVVDSKEAEAISALHAVTRQRALLVVDYAETRVGLRRMLADLASDRGDRVRVLLLARSAGDWWDQLGVGEPRVWDMTQAAKAAEMALSPSVAVDLSDADVIALAVQSFARELGLPERAVQIRGSGPARRRMLDLHAAALVAVLDDPGTATVQVEIGTVLGELLRHEMHVWYDSAQASGLGDGSDGLSPLMLRRIVAVSCLLGAATEEEARLLPGRAGLSPSARVAHWLRNLYPPGPDNPDWLGSLQPDRLAELHTVQELTASAELARGCLIDLDSRQARRAVTLLARASSDYPRAEALLSEILPEVAELIADLDAPRETLKAIFYLIPYPTVTLAQAAVAVCQRIVGLLPDDAPTEERAIWASLLSVRLAELGRIGEALPITEQAVEIRRALAATNPGRYRSGLAGSLNILGIWLSEVGRPADALPVAQESVSIYRELATANPNRHRSSLALNLANLGNRLSEVGRPADALQATEEAVSILQELARTNPDRHRPDLARLLRNLGSRLSEVGRPADGLQATEEAVSILQELARTNPDRHRPDLASSLVTLANTLSEVGRPADALQTTEEAVSIYRELAAADPDRHRPSLALGLNNLGFFLSEVGRPADALEAAEESVEIRRGLIAANLDRHRPGFASSLGNLASWLSEVGRPADALEAAEESVEIRRGLLAVNPGRHRPGLAESLGNLGSRLSEMGRPADALQTTEEAVSIYRELATANPGRYRRDLAESLTNLADIHDGLGQPVRADSSRNEAAKIEEMGQVHSSPSSRQAPKRAGQDHTQGWP